MSGHSKWSTIKRKKGAADAKRGKVFTRIIHELTVAVREGGGPDPDGNPRLRFALDKAKGANMPSDTIDRAIRRASGQEKGEEKQEVRYEGYGPGGAAVLVDVLTENRNRTVGDIRNAFTRCGGSLGESGCVGWMFKNQGVITIKREAVSEEQVMEAGLEAGADDVKDDGDLWVVTTEPSAFFKVKGALEKTLPLESAEVTMVPSTTVTLSGKEAEQMIRLLDSLDELDDVLNTHSNCDIVEP